MLGGKEPRLNEYYTARATTVRASRIRGTERAESWPRKEWSILVAFSGRFLAGFRRIFQLHRFPDLFITIKK